MRMQKSSMKQTWCCPQCKQIITTYIRLIDSMSRTGTMFLASGAFLIAFGGYLEKKRRMLLQQIISGGSNSEAIG